MHYKISDKIKNMLTINNMMAVRIVKLGKADTTRNPVILYG